MHCKDNLVDVLHDVPLNAIKFLVVANKGVVGRS